MYDEKNSSKMKQNCTKITINLFEWNFIWIWPKHQCFFFFREFWSFRDLYWFTRAFCEFSFHCGSSFIIYEQINCVAKARLFGTQIKLLLSQVSCDVHSPSYLRSLFCVPRETLNDDNNHFGTNWLSFSFCRDFTHQQRTQNTWKWMESQLIS